MNEPLSKDGRLALIVDAIGAPHDPCEVEELELLAEVLADPATWEQPRPELEHLVVDAVADAEASVSPLPSVPPVRKASRRRGLFSVAGIAAAAALVVAAVGVLGNGSGSDFTATLAGTPLAPSAHASASMKRTNSGFRIVLDAAHLPPLDSHHYYEAWLKGSDGVAVAVGTFSSSDGRVTLWSGASPAGAKLTVTVEPDDNNQASSGQVVLAGPVQTH
jgi:hypothetical protein